MSYGVAVPVLHDCGHELIVVDFDRDPPPIPMRVPAGVTSDASDGRWLNECPGCGDWVVGDELLAAKTERDQRGNEARGESVGTNVPEGHEDAVDRDERNGFYGDVYGTRIARRGDGARNATRQRLFSSFRPRRGGIGLPALILSLAGWAFILYLFVCWIAWVEW